MGDNGDAPLSQIEAACAWDHETLSAGDNPAEWLLEVTTESNGHPERVEALADACAKSPHTATEVAEIRKLAAAEKEAHAGHKGLVGTAPATVVGIIPAIATLLRYRSSRKRVVVVVGWGVCAASTPRACSPSSDRPPSLPPLAVSGMGSSSAPVLATRS